MEQEGHSNRPSDNALYQQRLSAWTPLMTYRGVSIYFIVIGVILLGLGVLIFITDQNVTEYVIDYTACTKLDSANETCDDASVSKSECICAYTFNLNFSIPPPVYFYYGLSNFYQNHRKVVNSYDMNQLMGQTMTPSSSCAPVWKDSKSRYYAPCGQMANVIFNDTFGISYINKDNVVPIILKDIALNSDLQRYGKPASWNNVVKPPNWQDTSYFPYKKDYNVDERLMVWMRPAPLSTFRKLHGKLNTSISFKDGLGIGNYIMYILYNYPVTAFGGRKYFIISNLSWLGGKNISLSIFYLVTGAIKVIIGLIFITIHLIHSRV